MNIFKKLKFKETEFGKIQSVDEMSIVPILGTERILSNKIAKPENLYFAGVLEYGSMKFINKDNVFGLIPSNLMIISDQMAQDHAMCDTVLLKGQENKLWKNACCIQQTQSGYMAAHNEQLKFNILPLELRKKALSLTIRKDGSFDKLWNGITSWLNGVPKVKSNKAHLEYFFRPYEKQLNDFVAQFEPVENQIGAVVYFGNECVGMEIMPNENYWNHYWKWIIRGCYGAELTRMKLIGKAPTSKISLPTLGKLNKIETDVDKFFNSVKDALTKGIPEIDDVSVKPYKEIKDEKISYNILDSDNIKGDIVLYEDKPIYSSIVF